MCTPGENLTKAIKDNLIQKANAYLDSSSEDRHKITIFTDAANVDLWKENVNVIIRTDVPLPTIPEDYDRTRGYDIVDEMEKFIGDYIRPSYVCRNVYWSVHNSGDEDRPRAHLIFAPHNLKDHVSVLLKRTDSKPLRCRHFSNARVDSDTSTDSSSSSSSSSIVYYYPSMSSESSVISSESSVDEASASADQASNVPAVDVQRRADLSANVPTIVVRRPTIPSEGSVEGEASAVNLPSNVELRVRVLTESNVDDDAFAGE